MDPFERERRLVAYRQERKRLTGYLLMEEPRQDRYWRERAIRQLLTLRWRAGLSKKGG